LTKIEFRIVGLTAIGGALEFYDFTIYALFASYIRLHFFDNTNPFIGFMNTFAVFALGYLARPLGGIVFGHLGDKLGRKSAFSLAVFIMAMATLLIGCLPDYQSIGIFAPIALILLRLIQGFSVGGEIPGATLFVFEHVDTKKRGLFIGLVFMCITLGNTLGGLVGFLLTTVLSDEHMLAWGWRIPFILGFFLGIISFYIRKKLVETPVFMQMVAMNQLQQKPFLSLLKKYRINILKAFLLTASISTISSFLIYLPIYLSTIMKIKISDAYLINVFSFLSIAITTAFWGMLSDYYSRKKLMAIGTSLLIILTIPLFHGLTTLGENFIGIFILSFALICGMVNSCYVILITELFPANLRYSGVGFSYSLGFAVIAGSAPLVFTGLIEYLHNIEAPAFYIVGCSILTLAATLFYDRRKKNYKAPMKECKSIMSENRF
jgi:MFS family permease